MKNPVKEKSMIKTLMKKPLTDDKKLAEMKQPEKKMAAPVEQKDAKTLEEEKKKQEV